MPADPFGPYGSAMTPKSLQLSVKACIVSILATLIVGTLLGANAAGRKRPEPWQEGYDQCVADYEQKYLQLKQDRLTGKHFAPYEPVTALNLGPPADPPRLPRPR